MDTVADRKTRNYQNKLAGAPSADKGVRTVHFEGVGGLQTRILDRYALKPGERFEGPVVIEERESTTVIGPSSRVSVDRWLNLIVEMD